MTSEKLNMHRTLNNMESKAITHFFDKVLNTNKNVLLFLPIYFSTVDKTLSTQLEFEYIFKELSSTTKFIYEYRQQHCANFDTFIIYIVKSNSSKESNFIISQFTENGLKYIEKIPMSSLDSISNFLSQNTFF